MNSYEGLNFEAMIFDYIDEIKFLFFPDQWSSAFLDYSKNEVLVMFFLYRRENANMTEISDYINAPLNTTTGVVGRLEKKQMVERKRDEADRRVVNIVLTKKAKEFIDHEKEIIGHYIKEVYRVLTDEEKIAAFNIYYKVLNVLKEGRHPAKEDEKTTKRVKRILIE
ncbi:MarR family transcriptional regulator [Alkaliphilus transvaalensis]|uniref:MarR family transcriptional regulator n=1 Tax=Alkaliphilus transvaalensis TaxID=114628 RepID=UPI00047C46E5|nr:MarR family transcriptional regulator [Alkaliphilus transvaalensis]